MPFASASLVRRIERAEATLIAEFGRAARRQLGDGAVTIHNIGGGMAVSAGPGWPFSKVAGLGFAPIDSSELDCLERMYDERATPVRVELPSLATQEIAATLTRRGYVLEGFENVLGLSLPNEGAAVTGVAVTRIEDHESADWLDVLGRSFSQPDVYEGASVAEPPVDRAALEAIFEQTEEIAGFVRYMGRREGEVAGAAGLRIVEGVAQLCGAATLPQHRRRGVQTALLRFRLADAARAGCDIAVVTTQPGSVSQQNAQRQGFEMLYARAVLVRRM
jgi:ribosomal protein S18 acetylase RimI-like enzyme